jgi:hypothetical protein
MNKSYTATIEHLVDGEIRYFEYPQIESNSYSMAVAHFERMALSNAMCGVITKIEVKRVMSEYIIEN